MTAAATTKQEKPSGLARYLPILNWLPKYNKSWLSGDLIAGLSVWALMVPTSMGYAAIAGVPVQYGLYAAAMGLIAFALFTGSRIGLARGRVIHAAYPGTGQKTWFGCLSRCGALPGRRDLSGSQDPAL